MYKLQYQDTMHKVLNRKNYLYTKEVFNKAISAGIEFKLRDKFKEKSIKKADLSNLTNFPTKQMDLEELLKLFQKKVLPSSTNFASPNFMGFPDSGNSIAGITGAILSDFLQQNLINESFCSPIATHLEIAVIKWLRKLVGYKSQKVKNILDVGGIVTYGGTGSNTTAMLLAREHHKTDTMENGITNPQDYKVIIPEGIGHYSIKSSLAWLGCGNNIIEVRTNEFKYDLNALEKAIEKNKGKIMAVVVYAGDSRTLTIDNLEKVYKKVHNIDPNIWLHVDACHGFSLAFSNKLKEKLYGIELFDSISTDPHKVLNIPYSISILLVKEPKSFKTIMTPSDLITKESFAFGQITPFIGSKSWISLKLWFLMKNMGIKEIGKIIEHRCDIAQYLKEEVLKSSEFILLNNVDINSVVFMYVGDKKKSKKLSIEYLNRLNMKIHRKILEEGIYHLHTFLLQDDIGILEKKAILHPLRYMSGNPNITKKDIHNLLKYIKCIGKKFEKH